MPSVITPSKIVRLKGHYEKYAALASQDGDREKWAAECYAANALAQLVELPMDAMERIPFLIPARPAMEGNPMSVRAMLDAALAEYRRVRTRASA